MSNRFVEDNDNIEVVLVWGQGQLTTRPAGLHITVEVLSVLKILLFLHPRVSQEPEMNENLSNPFFLLNFVDSDSEHRQRMNYKVLANKY